MLFFEMAFRVHSGIRYLRYLFKILNRQIEKRGDSDCGWIAAHRAPTERCRMSLDKAMSSDSTTTSGNKLEGIVTLNPSCLCNLKYDSSTPHSLSLVCFFTPDRHGDQKGRMNRIGFKRSGDALSMLMLSFVAVGQANTHVPFGARCPIEKERRRVWVTHWQIRCVELSYRLANIPI